MTFTSPQMCSSCLMSLRPSFSPTHTQQHGMDPAYHYTVPGLTWDAMLKKTGVELGLLTGYDQDIFIEKSMRGGTSVV